MTRQRHYGTFRPAPHSSTPYRLIAHSPATQSSDDARPTSVFLSSLRISAALCSVFALPLLTLPATAAPAPKAHKAISSGQKITRGVWGWTSGSQTYLRARPGAATPPVAKVPAHTKLFVWGKFNGWYRVETPDHTFGWVFHDYVNSNDAEKIATLSHSKAVEASERTANQTMYGSPELLKRHYALYGSPGAARGLAREGVHIAQHPTKPAARLAAKPPVKATKPSLVAQGTPKRSQPARLAAVKTNPASKTTRVAAKPPVSAPHLRVARAPITTPALRRPAPQIASTALSHPNAPKMAPAPRIAMSPATDTAPVTTSNTGDSTFAPAMSPIGGAPTTPVTPSAPTIVTPPVPKPQQKALVAPPKPVAKAAAPAAPKRQPAPAKPHLTRWQMRQQWKKNRAKLYAERTTRKREELRRRLGAPVMMVPPQSSPSLAPISPEELLRAQQAWMASQGNRASTDPEARSLPKPETMLTPSSFEGSTAGASTQPTLAPRMSTATLASRGIAANVGLAAASRGGLMQVKKSPSAAPFRGGSPRDYARYAAPNPSGTFGHGLANQALGYRGMPYIFGASNPRRGFDCSGLVYFLLRSRGYNPPRTAAGYARYGQGISRAQLQPGDLLLFANTYKHGISHIGVYMGEGKFVHAARAGEGVRVDSLSSAYYSHKFWGARRVK